jgi:AraC-like DNA-binding protein
LDARAEDAISDARRRALLAMFLMELVEPSRLDEPVRPPPFAPYARDDLVRRVIDHLQAHLAEGLDMAALCSLSGYSESRLRHLFRERAGVSISELMMRLRLDEARRLMHFSDLKISAIAHMVGFRQTPRFNHFFRQRMGCTPTQYVSSGIAFGAKWGEAETRDEVRVRPRG